MARIRTALIEDADEIALLASPTRIEIVDTLEALGDAASVAELAAAVGRPADGLYYHLRQLAEGGLIEEVAAPDGRRYRSRTRKGDRLRLRYRPGATANADAVGRVAASVLRVAGRDFARALADPDTVVEGPRRELWAARGKGWVDAAELAEINRLLARLMELVQKPATERPRGRLVALSWVLAPVEAKPARRAAAPRKPRAR
ncbi:DNA-binding transcriptional ArsR family regulator [Dokdonella fugitiva]|uniref:DNA-binding transcriptional ArsR family regulator n=1 Tax=Dokdonella fugitiva TaxID=328517 RepID=A0A839ET53_9GAMM|nr:helix-turn-helix domain-containing protein [Dokdonella fugitiva]MBA8887637.1 DNA-binding transcriptional ArsR family regulator [Dokdonella fugitiva]